MQPGSRFCAACGHAIDASFVESERRQLTLLFCDVVGSSTLSERLDPEDLHDLLASYQRACRDAIGLYEGHISQFLGDGVMSYFGYPIAHEDDAVRAVRAALRIVEDVKQVNHGIGRRLQAEIHLRVGVHTGVAVVGEIGPGGMHDRLAVGETVNLAARIQLFADVDAVLVSAPTATLVAGHFELQALGAQTLKGFTRPLELFRVLRSTGARTNFEAAARGKLTPHVGRQAELAQLAGAWSEVQEGSDRFVVVRGEAGIGKSRIVHHFRHAKLTGGGARVLECFCSPLTQATAFAPITEMLNGLVLERAGDNTTPQGRLDALASMLGEYSRFGADTLPLIAALLSISGADETPIQELSPSRRRVRTMEILRAWLASAAERVPVALIFEDVHWSDPSTLDFLDLLVREPPGGRTLVCVTARPEFLVRWPRTQMRVVELGRLDPKEIEAMVVKVAGDHALPAAVVTRISERSEGVPLFVEEVTKAALESSALRLEGERYELVRALDEQFLPPTVQGSLVARFDRLGESRNVAQLGAAIGREFTYPLMRAVAALPDDELREHLGRLSRSELAYVHGDPPHAVYTFKHALIQDAIYATLLKSERARVHGRIFAALKDEFPEAVAARPEVAAYHAENAGLRDAAVPLLRDAGTRALGRTAVAEAVKHLAHAIEMVDVLDERDRVTMEIDLQAAIGPAYMATVGWGAPEVERSSVRLKELAAARGDVPRLFQALWSLWTVYFLRAELDPALEVARQVMAMAKEIGDPLLQVTGHHAVGYSHFYRGEYQQALEHADAGMALFDLERERGIAAVFQLSSSCALLFFRALAQRMLGQEAQASENLRRAQGLAQDLRHAPSSAYLLCQLCYFFHVLDDVDGVQEWAPALRSLSVAEGFALWVPLADIFLAWVSARKGGDAALAAGTIEASMTLVHGSRTYLNEPDLAGMHAETLLLAGQPEKAFRVAQEALAITRPGRQRHCEPELVRLQGEAARAMGDAAQAAALFLQAIDSARAMGARLLELRSAAALARLTSENDRAPKT